MTSNHLLDQLLESIQRGKSVALLTVVQATGHYAEAIGKNALIWLNKPSSGDLGLGSMTARILSDATTCLAHRKPQLLTYSLSEGQIEVFVEVQRRPPTLLIVGAGHVALPLAQLGKMAAFEVVVLDDRPRFANKKRFPMVDKVLAQPFQETLRQWPIDHDTYIILVTRGHSHDVACLLEVIDSTARYIGMIGSKRRVRAVFELLEQKQGLDPSKLRRVSAPVGLDIGAETPTEIAIAIMAEIINIYRNGRAISLSEALRAERGLPLHPARSK